MTSERLPPRAAVPIWLALVLGGWALILLAIQPLRDSPMPWLYWPALILLIVAGDAMLRTLDAVRDLRHDAHPGAVRAELARHAVIAMAAAVAFLITLVHAA